MEDVPAELAPEVQEMGARKFNVLRRGALTLRQYDIEEDTIVDRLVAKGCTRNLATWLAREALRDELLGGLFDEDKRSWRLNKTLRALVALAGLFNIALAAKVIEDLRSYALLVLMGPLLFVASFVCFVLLLGNGMDAVRGRPRR